MAYELPDTISHLGGEPNIPGTGLKFWVVDHDDVDVFQDLPANPDVNVDSEHTTIMENVVLKAGKRFTEIFITQATGHFFTEAIGPNDTENEMSIFEAEVPGSNDAVERLHRYARNRNMLVIIQELNGQQKRIMGNAARPAKMKFTGVDHGQDGADQGRVKMIRVEWFWSHIAPKYNGVVDVDASGS